MRTFLHDPTLIHDKDAVGMLDGRQAMRDGQHGLALRNQRKLLLQQRLGLAVKR